MQRRTFTALNSVFVVDAEYEFVKELGQGAYGCVVSARHRRTGEGCAIKKITNINTKVYLSHLTCSKDCVMTSIFCVIADLDQALFERDQVRPSRQNPTTPMLI